MQPVPTKPGRSLQAAPTKPGPSFAASTHKRLCSSPFPPAHYCRREALARWRAYFYFRFAEHSLTHAGPEGAGEALDKLEGDGALRLSPVERTLCLLCRATLALTAGDAAAAAPLLKDVSWEGLGGAGSTAWSGRCMPQQRNAPVM